MNTFNLNEMGLELSDFVTNPIIEDVTRSIFKDRSFSCSTYAEVNADVLEKLFGKISNDPKPSKVTLTYLKQSRRHRKRRINKKWLKRYGYVHVTKTYPASYIEKIDWNKDLTKLSVYLY